MMNTPPDFILFAQHGWADTAIPIQRLANALAPENAKVIAPNLGWWSTWIHIHPLIETVESIALKTLAEYPQTPLRIVAHSMGGLIWLEVLKRHPEMRSRVHSLVLIASPVGGADLARIIDPFKVGIGIARDLGTNRRAIAEQIARQIPTLAIAGDIGDGSDGTIPVQSTRFKFAQFLQVKFPHPALKDHPSLIPIIQEFWDRREIPPTAPSELADELIERLSQVPGMTDTNERYLSRAQPVLKFQNGLSLCIWRNLCRINHVFLINPEGQVLFSGFVGWWHSRDLRQALKEIETQYQHWLLTTEK